jgi:hypothetical protein
MYFLGPLLIHANTRGNPATPSLVFLAQGRSHVSAVGYGQTCDATPRSRSHGGEPTAEEAAGAPRLAPAGTTRVPPPPLTPEPVRLRAGVLRFRSRATGCAGGGEFGELASFLAFTAVVEPKYVSLFQVILVATADSSEGMQQQRNKLISETLRSVTTVTDEVHSCSFSEQKLLCCLRLHLLLMQFHFSDYRRQVCERFSSANVRLHAQGHTCTGCRCRCVFRP